MDKRLNSLAIRFFFVFCLGFILTLPNSTFLLPNFGELFRPISEGICKIIRVHQDDFLHSDSSMMFTWIIVLVSLSLLITIIWTFLQKRPFVTIHFWLSSIASYYLSLSLFVYGLNKVFKFQFFFPEPNTLFTPLGQLSPDILFWSSMGTSHSYNVFMGLIEIIPALLLLFRKTRLIGALIAFGVLLNVVMINFSFGISVKIYSSFLLLLCLILLQPHFKRFYFFFIKDEASTKPQINNPFEQKPYRKMGRIIKAVVILLILIESFGPYIAAGSFNGDRQRNETMRAAYRLEENPQQIKRVYFHSQGYFIIQTLDDSFNDYQSTLIDNQLYLTDYNAKKCTLSFIQSTHRNTFITGSFFGTEVKWTMQEIDLQKMPIYQSIH